MLELGVVLDFKIHDQWSQRMLPVSQCNAICSGHNPKERMVQGQKRNWKLFFMVSGPGGYVWIADYGGPLGIT